MTPAPATYRLQLHAEFAFADAAAIVPYLARLGITHLYLSPVLAARPGSAHGYDVVDPTRVSDELGGEHGLRQLVAAARRAGLGILLDIVPNHMAVGPDNPWWQDVLANGPSSRWAPVFDIDWKPADPALVGRVLCPFLDRPYGEALAGGLLALAPDARHGWVVRHHDTPFPIRPEDRATLDAAPPRAFDPTDADGRRRLHRLLERQHYRLAWWRTAGDEVNWRRFFDIGELVSVRVEDEPVFALTHATVLRLYREGLVDGVRVDHIDGLADPAAYCRRLRQALRRLAPMRPPEAPAGPAWLLVEKILAADETLPEDWDVDGTTGYDFMDEVGALLHDPAAAAAMAADWAELSGRPADFRTEERTARREMLARSFAAQLDRAAAALHRLARLEPATRDWTRAAIGRCVAALAIHFPVYRTYATATGRSASDDRLYRLAAAGAATELAPADRTVLDGIGRWLGGGAATPATAGPVAVAIRRFQQLTAPLAAKSVEDTAFYRFGRLLSRNEVGADPACFARRPAEFHAAQAARARTLPAAMLATATHDHKRGEDVRARLSVVASMPAAWRAALADWLPAGSDPSRGDAAMLCQTLVGAWPLDLDPEDAPAVARFAERVAAWQTKALREAKLRTEWTVPDPAYEAAARTHLDDLLGDPWRRRSLARFVDRIAPAGAVAGLAQLVLRLTVPGAPDTYQGSEFWDFSLVDPDNRRAVDYPARATALAGEADPAVLLPRWRDGRVKQAILARLLRLRRQEPDLFRHGRYEALPLPEDRGLLGFLRHGRARTLAVLVPVRPGSFRPPPGAALAIAPALPAGLMLPLPDGPTDWLDVLGTRRWSAAAAGLPVERLLAPLPVSVLLGTARSKWTRRPRGE
ncbi:malto-oligosyltrehalose synthase [Stella sp.]|uniref:malto-oligosyltrehalose synthase n=1 Tax=Stella sp. TaxID=2912054 RepID=UPI0035B0A290